MRPRFPLHNPAFPGGKVYRILDKHGNLVAEIVELTAEAALAEARLCWPESRTALKRIELAFDNRSSKVQLSL